MADILSDLRYSASQTADETPKEEAPSTLPGVLGFQYEPSKEEKDAQAKILEGGTKKEEAAKQYAEDIKPITGELTKKLSEPRPKMPAAPVEPPPPSRRIRPFAENTPGEPWQATAQKALLNLGLLAQGIAGIAAKYPQGALASFTGAMNGWNAGDKERGDRAFADWYEQVDQMRHHYQQQRQAMQDLIDQHQGDIESLKAKLAVRGIELGANEKVIEAGQENPLAILNFANANWQKGAEVWKQANQLMAAKRTQDYRDAMLAESQKRTDLERQRLNQTLTPGADGGLSDEAADLIADVFAKTGQMPPLGMGKVGTANREKVFNALAEKQKRGEIPEGGIPLAKANYAADKAALTTMRKQEAQILAFERTANSSATYALGLSDKVGRSDSPVLNRWILAGRKATGDPDVANFHAATETFINEYSKIVSSATGGGVTPEAAREHAREMLNTAMSPAQYRDVVNTLKQEMEFRRNSLTTEINVVVERMSGKTEPSKPQGGETGTPSGWGKMTVR